MHPDWPDVVVNEGELLKLTCPVDTRNSCLIDFVQWYHSPSSSDPSSRRSLREGVAAFDPLILYKASAELSHGGFYTCVVGNYAGRAEATVRVTIG
jgi:hypothetical protein